jgi:hypothetical protein
MGYVTIDTSEWAIDGRLRKRLNDNPNADLTAYRDFYLEHIWERAQFYDQLARKVTGETRQAHSAHSSQSGDGVVSR